jgi:hypothetical protein
MRNFVLLTVHLDIFCNENQPDALFTLIYFVSQPLHASGIFIVHHQEVFTGPVRMEFHPDLVSCQST